ncbi:hypothetical protein N7530_002394 [Penicillium desertorum]|uniref:Uncharacterized protein n=1 Tax=Penicillium desertorum TaxID=1303715 RepID=A0A9X0BFQ8_9EURO|nr:hypothetical protein N7530_012757 [Penicillium desertorum]KAJ5483148.1 hypothetical protein N7530_002394 [Penicillium desertorum]
MARPSPYSRPQAPSIGFKNSTGPTHVQFSPLPAAVHRNAMLNCPRATYRAQALPKTQSPERTGATSGHSTAVSATQHRPGQCRTKRARGSVNRAQQLQEENERLIIQHDQDKVEIRQLREQLMLQEESHQRYKESMQKFLQNRHVKGSSVVKSANIPQSGTRAGGIP